MPINIFFYLCIFFSSSCVLLKLSTFISVIVLSSASALYVHIVNGSYTATTKVNSCIGKLCGSVNILQFSFLNRDLTREKPCLVKLRCCLGRWSCAERMFM